MLDIFAHRGASATYPENTMIAFQKGTELGASGIELDVHLTRDNKIVVMHDETIDRTTNGKGWISQFTYDELRQFDASNKWKKKVGFCHIPLLDEVLYWLTKNQLKIIIELKNSFLPYVALEEGVINLTRYYELDKRTIFSTFNYESIIKLQELAPNIETALLVHYKTSDPHKLARRLGIKAIHSHYKIVDREMAKMCQKSKIILRTYTVNQQKDIERMVDYGCQGIITDYPERVVEVFNKYR